MVNDATSRIIYGIKFEAGYEFPWDEKCEGDFEKWWIYEICRYKPPFEIWDNDGEYINGIKPSEEKEDEYYNHLFAFQRQNKPPLKLINYCSYDQSMFIVAIPKDFAFSEWAEPDIIDLEKLKVTDEERQSIIDFCKKYCRPAEDDEYSEFPKMEPQFYLTSFWG